MRVSRIIGAAAALTFAGFVFYSLLHTEPVKVHGLRLQHRDGLAFLTGELENTGRDEAAVDLEVHYYDSNGHQIAFDTVPIAPLSSGETRTFAAPKRDLPGVVSYSMNLNHGRNPYGN